MKQYREGSEKYFSINAVVEDEPIVIDALYLRYFHYTLKGDLVISEVVNPSEFYQLAIFVEQDEVGGHIISFPSNFWFEGGVSPTITFDPGSITIINAFYSKGRWLCGVSNDLLPVS